MAATLAVVTVVAVTALLVCGCGSDDAAPGADGTDQPTIVATTSIWADVVSNLACGGLAEVESLVPVGGDPHSFEPSLADRGTMEDAALVVANGLLLEEGLADTIDAVEAAGNPVFRIAEHIETIPYSFDGETDDHADEEESENGDHDHVSEGDDPHVWFDPQRVLGVLDELAGRLVSDAGLDSDAVETCVEAYRSELSAVDTEIAEMVAAVPEANRQLVTSHDSLGYFADRYGFEVIGTVIPASSGLAEANPAQLEELARLIEETAVPAIFAETQHSTDDAEALAERVGDVEIVTLFTGTLGDPDSGADTYLGFLRTNAELITSALR